MGCVENVGFDKFPKQGRYLHKHVVVCFDYDSTKTIGGRVVRDDEEEPGKMIINLEDGRFVLSTECMWQPVPNRQVKREAN